MTMNMAIRNVGDNRLVRANEIIGRFITSCSHSMRGPLKTIAGLVNLLQSNAGCSDKERQQFLQLIAATSLKMENMLDELEHFLENTKRDMTIERIDLNKTFANILQDTKARANALGLQVQVMVQPGLTFYSDPHRLRLILSNLVANATQFYDPAKANKTLQITASEIGNNVRISVADNGIGIDKASQRKVFNLFFRGSERSGGAGVGLYVVNEVVTKMGGTIELNSELGVGSKFVLHLPNLTPTATVENEE
ncbi:MAG: sensor histidine kinase [Bacteroidota bacterium]